MSRAFVVAACLCAGLGATVADAAPPDGAPVPPAAVQLVIQSRAALSAGRSADAVALLERARDAAPGSVPVLLALVDAYATRVDEVSTFAKLGYGRKIKATLQSAVAAAPRDRRALYGLYGYHVQAPAIAGGSAQEAERLGRELAAVDAAWGRRAAALRHTQDGDRESAARELRAAIVASPDDPALRMDLILNAQGRKAWDEAHAEAEKLAATGHRGALYQVGRTGALGGQHLERAEAALRAYLAGSAVAPVDQLAAGREAPADAAWYRLGQVLAHTPARRAEARAALERALQLNPRNEGAKKALAGLR